MRALQVTTYDIRHEAMLTGTHLVHIKLKGTHIQNSPLSFQVHPDRAEPVQCKLVGPKDPLHANETHTAVVTTFDRYGNACDGGGLMVTAAGATRNAQKTPVCMQRPPCARSAPRAPRSRDRALCVRVCCR